ncbi:MAG: GNAT family N-acetyltransferase [Janthinobacterium lividum]
MTHHPLDNPVWESLTTTHTPLAEGGGGARRYPADVSPFTGLADATSPDDWADLAALVGAGSSVLVPTLGATPPAGFTVTESVPGVQLLASDAVRTAAAPEAVVLGAEDVEEMLDLVQRTKPGPFGARTRLLGNYLGIRDGGRLVAMAGERLRPPGFTEISAVCTDPAVRGRGLATRLVLAVAHGIRERGETPFLHAAAVNTRAIRLYESLGFTLRRPVDFTTVHVQPVD